MYEWGRIYPYDGRVTVFVKEVSYSRTDVKKKYFYPSKVFNPTGINSQLLKATGFEAVYLKTDRE